MTFGQKFISDEERHGWSLKKLEELLDNYNIKNVILLSGDIHQGRVSVKNHLIEVTSSPLISFISRDKVYPIIGNPLNKNNFGFLDINLENKIYHTSLVDLNQGKFHNIIKFYLK